MGDLITDPTAYGALTAGLLGLVSLGTQALTWFRGRAEKTDKSKAEAKAKAEREAGLNALRAELEAAGAAQAQAHAAELAAIRAELATKLGALSLRLDQADALNQRNRDALGKLDAHRIRSEGEAQTLRRDLDSVTRRSEGTRDLIQTLSAKVGETLAGLQAEVRHLGNQRGPDAA